MRLALLFDCLLNAWSIGMNTELSIGDVSFVSAILFSNPKKATCTGCTTEQPDRNITVMMINLFIDYIIYRKSFIVNSDKSTHFSRKGLKKLDLNDIFCII